MASNRKEIWLIDTLRRHPGVTFDDIESLYKTDFRKDGLPKRTFRNMLDGLAQNHGIFHVCKQNRYSLKDPIRAENNSLVNLQVSMFTMHNIVQDNMPETRCIEIDDIPSADERLNTIITAIKSRSRCRTFYRSCKHSDGYMIDFDPYGVKLCQNSWYVVCKSHLERHNDRDLSTFCVERMEDVEILKKKFTLRKSFSVEKYFEGCIGVLREEDSKPESILIHVRGWKRNKFRNLPFHKSQKYEYSGEDYDAYSYMLRPNKELITAFLKFGSEVEVISPVNFRNKIIEEIRRMTCMYDIDCLDASKQLPAQACQNDNSGNHRTYNVYGDMNNYPNAQNVNNNGK